SVVGSKYVVVRGLSERYSSTQLNGVNLPSPEPEKKVVPFDMFPSAMINRITTVKTFTPDNPGDFAGGLVKITTKEFPESFFLSASIGTGGNTETQGADAISYAGGGTDYLGIDDGTRALPRNIATERLSTADEQASLLSKFSDNVWLPRPASLPVNQSYSLSLGNQYDVGFPIGFLVSGSYGNSYSFRRMEQAYPLLEQDNGRRSLRYDYDTRLAERSTLWGGLVNLSAQFSPDHKVSFKGVYNHSADDESRQADGLYNQSARQTIRYTRLRFLERGISSLQLDGEHHFESILNSRLEWRGAISTASRYEPDNRSTTYLLDGGRYLFGNNFGSNNSRFFSNLNDRESNLGLDWTVPFATWGGGISRIKLGGLGRFRDRDFSARRFLVSVATSDPEILALPPEELITPENVRSGTVGFNDNTENTDNYTASEKILAGYAMVDLPLTRTLRFIGGARVESWHSNLFSVNPRTGLVNSGLGVDTSITDILPSINLIQALGDEMNLRASFSRTVARPEFRELAPFRFDDYRQSTFGNPALHRTAITNYDLRWEWFPGGGEVIAASGYYKSFNSPIEQIYFLGGSGISVEPSNASHAMIYGGEFEFRKGLGFIAPSLENFSLGTNLTLAHSEVRFDAQDTLTVFDGTRLIPYSAATLTDTTAPRPLQGQSPYVINATLGYDNLTSGTSVTLLYNVFGRRLAIVGSSGVPDTYEMARNTVDLTISQRFPAGLQLRLTARNLLDELNLQQQEFPDGEVVQVESYRAGRSISLGISFNLDQLAMQNSMADEAPHE
ncbi:MAG: TonB-dependent receptor, partial [Bacteroidota bacterium]